MNVYEALINGYSVDDYANEGKVEDFLKRFKEKIDKAVSKVIEFIQKIAANIAAAASRLPSQASKADKNIKPIIENVDKMISAIISTYNFAIGKNRDTVDINEWEDELNESIEKIKSIRNTVNNLCDNLDFFSKVGAKLASIGIKGWIGKLKLIQNKLKTLESSVDSDSSKMLKVINDQISLTISTINTVCNLFNSATKNKDTKDENTKIYKNFKVKLQMDKAIDENNIEDIRLCLTSQIVSNHTITLGFKDGLEYLLKVRGFPEEKLYEKFDPELGPLSSNKIDKNDETLTFHDFSYAVGYLTENFCHERIKDVDKICRYLFENNHK